MLMTQFHFFCVLLTCQEERKAEFILIWAERYTDHFNPLTLLYIYCKENVLHGVKCLTFFSLLQQQQRCRKPTVQRKSEAQPPMQTVFSLEEKKSQGQFVKDERQ